MPKDQKRPSRREERERQRKQQQRKQQARTAGLAALAVAGLAGLAILLMNPGGDTDRSYLIGDQSRSGELTEFIEPVAAMAWLDAAVHDRDLQTGTVGGDTVDFTLVEPITPEEPCQTETDDCRGDRDTAADTWASGFASTVQLASASGSDLIGPLVELDGASGTLWYVTDGCVATADPPLRLCANLPADESAAAELGRRLAADYGIEGALDGFGDVYLIGVGSTTDGGFTGQDATILRSTLTALLEAAGVEPDGIHVTAGLPTTT